MKSLVLEQFSTVLTFLMMVTPTSLGGPHPSNDSNYQTFLNQNWSADIRLTYDNKWSNWPSIGIGPYGGLHVVWVSGNDIRGGELHYMKLDMDGNVLKNDTKITEMSSFSRFPEVAADDLGNVHISYLEGTAGTEEVYYLMLDNSGIIQIDSTRISYINGQTFYPWLDTDSQNYVHIVWREGIPIGGIKAKIYYTKIDPSLDDLDGDSANLTMVSLVNNNIIVDDGHNPRIVVDSWNNIHLSFTRSGEIFYKMMDDAGDPLIGSTRMTYAPKRSDHSSIVVDTSQMVYITWRDERSGKGSVIFYTKIDPNLDDQNGDGANESEITLIDDFRISGTELSGFPATTISKNNQIDIVWPDGNVFPKTIYRSQMDSSGNLIIDKETVTQFSSDNAIAVSHIVDSAANPLGQVYITWWDNRDGQDEIYLKYSLVNSNLPPKAEAVVDGGEKEGSPTLFNGSSSYDPEGGALHFTWDFDSLVDSDGDGNFINDVDATGPTPTHTYYDNNNYTVTLKVTDDSGQSDTATSTATILNVAPTAEADGPYEGDEPHTVQFTGTFTDPGTLDTHTFQWDFDFDGITFNVDSTEQNPTHQWLDDFNGSVAFKVIDDDGGWDLDVTDVTVNNLPPKATANGPYDGFEGTPIQFNANHTDPGPLDTHTYEWDFSYDGATFIPDATGNPYQKTWYDDYSGNIALRVTDDDRGWDLDITTVTIVNVPPIANAGDDKKGFEVSTFTFNGSFYDPGSNDTHEFEWDFDYDGITFDVEATGQSVSQTWTDDFNGQIALRVTDDDGGADIDTAHVLVKNVAPTVTLEVLPIELDPFLRIAGEKWHDVSIELFEDGVLIANGTLVRYPGSPNDQMVDLSSLQFDHSKNYTATVTYTPDDDPMNGQPNGANPCWIILKFSDGQELWIYHTFNVQHPDTYVWEVDLTAAILSHGMTFEAIAFDPGADELTFHWDFGDGTNATSFYSNANGTYPVQISETINHVFPGSGTYVVVLTVEDDDGGVGTASLTIVIP
ncbi:MAG: PKD domain-containing protein [Thermoplasmata archaeon]